MKRLTGVIVSGVLLSGALLAIAPLGVGFVVKKHVQAIVTNVDTTPGFSAKITSYDQGWFSSNATVTYSMTLPEDQTTPGKPTTEQPISFQLVEKIHHGPIVLSNKLKPTNNYIHFLLALVETRIDEPQVIVNGLTIMNFAGDISTQINSEKLTSHHATALGSSFVLQGVDSWFDFTANQKQVTGQMLIKAFDVASGSLHQRAHHIELAYHLVKDPTDLWLGDRLLTIGKFDFETKANQKISAKETSLKFSNDISHQRMRSVFSGSIKSVEMDGTDYGKQLISFSFSNIDVNSYAEMAKQVEQLQSTAPEHHLVLFGSLYTQAMTLLSKGVDFHLDQLAFNTAWGVINAQAQVTLPEQQQLITSLPQVFLHLKAHASISIPIRLASELLTLQNMKQFSTATDPKQAAQEAARKQLDAWVNAGYLLPNETNYGVEITYQQHQLLLNGKPFEASTIVKNPVDVATTLSSTNAKAK